MENNFESVLDMFLFEANGLLEQLDEILLKVEEEKEFSTDCVNEIFRIMHTIKGSAAMMQFTSIMTTAHRIEDLFYYIRENGLQSQFTEDLINLVFKCTDFIKSEIEKIQNEQPLTEDISGYVTEIENLLAVVSGKADPGSVKKDGAVPADGKAEGGTGDASGHKYCIKVNFDDDCGMENLRSFMIVNQLNDVITGFTYEPEGIESDKGTIQTIIDNGFKIYIDSDEDIKHAEEVVKNALNVKDYSIIESELKAEEKKAEVASATASTPAAPAQASAATPAPTPAKPAQQATGTTGAAGAKPAAKQSLISVNLSKLDELSNIVGEIIITESMVVSNPEVKGLNLDSFTKASRELRKLTDELQSVVMSLRMVPVSGVFQKMKRIVRDMNKSLNKDVDLVLVGDDIEVDKIIVDGIADPIMHLVRNSMDHGIEPTEDRIKKGKNPKGKVTLTAVNTGGEILIMVEDDGKGLNPEYILSKARAKNLLTKPESEYSPKEIYQIVMLPGFSTKEAVTEFSGRGVGMDVVKKNIEEVGGTVILDSKVDKGTTITFKIPLTLAIMDGMQVVVGNSEFIIPTKNIQQSLNINKSDIVANTDGSEGIMLRNKCYSVVRLHEVYGIETNVKDLDEGILILVEVENKSYAIFADRLIGEQKVVIKPLPTLLSKFDVKGVGISGCSILGDGSISLIIDGLNLYEHVLE